MTGALQDAPTHLQPHLPGAHADLRQPFRLRRHGESPLRFVGWLLQAQLGAPAIVVAPSCFWHELGLYQTVDGLFVVEIVAWARYRSRLQRTVRYHARAFLSLE